MDKKLTKFKWWQTPQINLLILVVLYLNISQFTECA